MYVYMYAYMYMNIIYTRLSYECLPFDLLILVDMARPAQITQNNEFAKSLQCFKKELSYKVDVSMLVNIKVFYKLIVLFLMGLARHTQCTWVNLQYLL